MKRRKFLKNIIAAGSNSILLTNGLKASKKISQNTYATEYHVAKKGNDKNKGTANAPFLTIQCAADIAQPGDVITVHEGIYREEVNPPRGGTSDKKRIVYQAASEENVDIRGSEVVKNWTEVSNGVWKTVLPNTLFNDFNPFGDEITGDWFRPKNRKHHTGNVYLNEEELFEAAQKEHLFSGNTTKESQKPMINMAWFEVNGKKYEAAKFTESENLKTAKSTEPFGTCIGWIYNSSWATYKDVEFGTGTDKIDLRLAIPSQDVRVEIYLNNYMSNQNMIGTIHPSQTGGWQEWKTFSTKTRMLKGKKAICIVFRNNSLTERKSWYAEVGSKTTNVWAQFMGENPNNGLTEVNVRQIIFYPRKPFQNHITVRGFKMCHAAPKWAPPTAEQMGLIGTHWSKGWIIENNEISHSINVGISLGKYGDKFDNAGATAQAYLDSIDRARKEMKWNKQTIGSHIIRNNKISWCEQAGIVGSMGAAFSRITDNHIHHIYTQRRFGGAEMAGIKFHAPIDMLIARNRIHDTPRAIWLDWMTQGTRVKQNLCYHNSGDDMFLEVNHGPFLIDNNLFLSKLFKHHSQGGAYVHNLFGGIVGASTDKRHTPYFKAHSTEKVGDHVLNVGDDRFYNNQFDGNNGSHIDPGWWESMQKNKHRRFGYGLWIYETRPQAPQTGGNIYYNGAKPYPSEDAVIVKTNPNIRVEEKGDEVFLHITLGQELKKAKTQLVSSKLLGKAEVPQLPFETPAGKPYIVDTDYFGKKRDLKNPSAGPFEKPGSGSVTFKVWPIEAKQ